jgi:hypothetical protein
MHWFRSCELGSWCQPARLWLCRNVQRRHGLMTQEPKRDSASAACLQSALVMYRSAFGSEEQKCIAAPAGEKIGCFD